MLRKLSAAIFGVLLVFATVSTTQAQFGIGGSYEIRNQAPETGFGVRIEKGINLPIPLIGLGIRASASHFSEQNSITRTSSGTDVSFDRDIRSIDYGITLLGKVKLGFVKPYIGIGVGGTKKNLDIENVQAPNLQDPPTADEIDKNSWNYHGLIGGEFSIIPLLNPFIEYRINDYSASMNLESNQQQLRESVKESNGRIMFGVMLRF